MYNYEDQKAEIFTDSGQRMFLAIRDKVAACLKVSGAVRLMEATERCGGGDSWTMIACMDRMVELREIREITDKVPGQYRVFVKVGE